MDLKEQLQQLFPDHKVAEPDNIEQKSKPDFWIQELPISCKYEKRRGKPVTIIEGYNGTPDDIKKLSKFLKTTLGVGGSSKNESIVIQGDYRQQIMNILKEQGFQVKRVGG